MQRGELRYRRCKGEKPEALGHVHNCRVSEEGLAAPGEDVSRRPRPPARTPQHGLHLHNPGSFCEDGAEWVVDDDTAIVLTGLHPKGTIGHVYKGL